MRRRTLTIATVLVFAFGFGSAANAQESSLTWKKLDVVAKLGNDGRFEVSEVHDVVLSGSVLRLSRDFRFSADQSAIVHGVHRFDALGQRIELRNVEGSAADSYQAYRWGILIQLRGEKDPPVSPEESRRYVIEYELVGALTPAWDLAAGPFPQGGTTSPRNPIERAREVWAGWKQAFPDLGRHYRVDHDLAFPTADTGTTLPELNYRFEYGTSWVLLDEDVPVGVANPEVDYRVQRTLKFLPDGRPEAVTIDNAAFRLFALGGPLTGGLVLLSIFFLFNRLLTPKLRVDREIFEKQIGSAPPELIAARMAGGGRAPDLEDILTRLAAQRKLAIIVVSPETDDDPAVVEIRLTTARDKLHPVDREVIERLMGGRESISTADIQLRYKKEGFNPGEIIREALEKHGFKTTRPQKVRVGWTLVRFAFLIAAVACAVKSLLGTNDDPVALVMILVPGTILGGLWSAGSSTQQPSFLSLLLGVMALGLLGAAMAISPNTPLVGFAALGLGLAGISHAALLLSRVPQSTPRDLEFMAARAWGLDQLKRPRPALTDAWVGSIEAMGGAAALKRWRAKYGGQMGSAPDLSEMNAQEMPSGPPFTGEAPPEPVLEPDWSEGFSVYDGDDEDD